MTQKKMNGIMNKRNPIIPLPPPKTMLSKSMNRVESLGSFTFIQSLELM